MEENLFFYCLGLSVGIYTGVGMASQHCNTAVYYGTQKMRDYSIVSLYTCFCCKL